MIGGTRCERAENDLDSNVEADASDASADELEEESNDAIDEPVLESKAEVEGDTVVKVVGKSEVEVEVETETEAEAATVADVGVADSEAEVETELESEADSDDGKWKLHLPSGFGAVFAARCLFALPYLFWNGSNGAVDDEEKDAMIGAKWVLEKEKVGVESDQVFIEAVPSGFAAAAVTSSSFFSSCSSSFRSTFRSLLSEGEGEAPRGNSAEEDALAVVDAKAERESADTAVLGAGACAGGRAVGCCCNRGVLVLRILCFVFCVPRSASRVPRSAFCVPRSAFRVPRSAFCVPRFAFRSTDARAGEVDARVRVAGVEAAAVAASVAEAVLWP
jgi:hypothetical protein